MGEASVFCNGTCFEVISFVIDRFGSWVVTFYIYVQSV